jgi:hypothetical protein
MQTNEYKHYIVVKYSFLHEIFENFSIHFTRVYVHHVC